MKLKKSIVEGTPLPQKGQTILWDDDIKGFGIRLTRGSRTYIAQARVKGVSRRVSLGSHGTITLQEARKKAKRELSSMLEGKDPSAEKKTALAYSKTLKDITEAYLKDRRDLKESSKADIIKHLNKSFASWAERPAVEITRDRVMKKFAELSDRSGAQANQAFRVLRAILNYARAKHRIDDKPIITENPVRILSDAKLWNRIRPRSGRIPTMKVGIAWEVIQELRKDPGQSIIGQTLADAVAFLLLTGSRWSEMAKLQWGCVNLEERWWYISDPKNRSPVTFPLSHAAVEILEGRERGKSDYIFPARSKDGHISDARSVMKKISQAIGVEVTPHDLRRTFRAIAGECHIELWKTKLLMGHKMSGDVTITHYTETEDLQYLEPEINLISKYIINQGVIAQSDKVLPFPSRKEGQG